MKCECENLHIREDYQFCPDCGKEKPWTVTDLSLWVEGAGDCGYLPLMVKVGDKMLDVKDVCVDKDCLVLIVGD